MHDYSKAVHSPLASPFWGVMMSLSRHVRCFIAGLLALSLLAPFKGHATTVVLDYRYDTAGFFDPGTSNGAAARATLDAAATFFSGIIDDALNAIPFTDPNTPGGSNTPVWRQVIRHPGTGVANYSISSAASAAQDGLTATQGAANEFRDIQIGVNQILIYAGATSITSAGEGGTGVGYFGSAGFNLSIAQRGKTEDEYATWGGYVTFDNDGGVNWHYNHTQPVTAGKLDLYSTALHEIGHVLGLNPSLGGGGGAQWDVHQVGAEFRGPEALAAWKADDPSAPGGATGIPTVNSTNTHWKDNLAAPPQTASVRSKIIGTNTLQEAAMDPTIFTGSRKLFTNVDAKALRDIGWTIPNSVFNVTPSFNPADFNEDTFVNGDDLTLWRGAFGINANGDADDDGDSDGQDFLIWQGQLGATSLTATAIGASSAVPEPQAALLAACMGLGFQMARRLRQV